MNRRFLVQSIRWNPRRTVLKPEHELEQLLVSAEHDGYSLDRQFEVHRDQPGQEQTVDVVFIFRASGGGR